MAATSVADRNTIEATSQPRLTARTTRVEAFIISGAILAAGHQTQLPAVIALVTAPKPA